MVVLAWHFLKPCVQVPVPLELSMVVHSGNPSSQQVRAAEAETQVHPQLHIKYEASLRCIVYKGRERRKREGKKGR